MEKTTKNWLIGCGIGCGAIVVILLILIVSGFVFFRNIVYKFEETEDITNALKDLYGEIEDYVPEPDGAIRYDRLEAFLSVRVRMSPAREKLDNSLSIIEQARKDKDEVGVRTPGRGIRVFKTAFGLIPQIGDFFTSRSQSLLEVKMGLGEYYYIYVLAYYSWLGKSPGDGPGIQLVQRDRSWSFNEWDEEESREEREKRVIENLNRLMLAMLKNQLNVLEEQSLTPAMKAWKTKLTAEIRELEEDSFRLPWQDGLPEAISRSFRSFRSRLEASYSSMTNVLEMIQD